MLEFTRVLTPSEVKILDVLRDYHGDRHFGRHGGKNLDRSIKRLKETGIFVKEISHDDENYTLLISALEQIKRFLRREIGSLPLLPSIDHFLFENIDDYLYREEFEAWQHRFRWLKKRFQEYENVPPSEQAKQFTDCIKQFLRPTYQIHGRYGFPNEKVERCVKSLYGLISIELGHYGQYDDIFIPQQVYEKLVIPALNDARHEFKVKIEDDLSLEIFNYIYARTAELRKKYGSDFRPKFTRPEICREVGIKMPPSYQFKETMGHLEGLLGRIDCRDSFDSGLKRNQIAYSVKYYKHSWFLPLKHQRLLEKEKN